MEITAVVEKNNGDVLDYKENEIDCRRISADTIKNNFQKIFGIDADYQDANVSLNGCGFLNYYNKDDNSYYVTLNCGGAYDHVDSVRKTYKAELKNDLLYVYDYAVIYHDIPAINSLLVFDSYEEFKNYESSENGDSSKYLVNNEKEINLKLDELIATHQANTYVWTFKKQSDGKYYYYSSKWQD